MTRGALQAIEEGPYGRCVYRCDNDVVDYQFTQMTFKSGVKAAVRLSKCTVEK